MPIDDEFRGARQRAGHHPIEALMETAMASIKEIVNVNTILGEPIEAADGSVIIPVSRVSLGFAAGGTEYEPETATDEQGAFPFGGGSGAGVSLSPVAFMVVGNGETRLLPIQGNTALFDRMIDLAPKLIEQFQGNKRASKAAVPPTADNHYEPAGSPYNHK